MQNIAKTGERAAAGEGSTPHSSEIKQLKEKPVRKSKLHNTYVHHV
jgi:hypothetical protein